MASDGTEILYVRGIPKTLMKRVKAYAKRETGKGGRTSRVAAICSLLESGLIREESLAKGEQAP
jgi:hypothetical protein